MSEPNGASSSSNDLMSLVPLALAFASGATGDDGEVAALKAKLRTWAKDDPMDAFLATILGGGLAFYLAERDTNPACTSAWDGVLAIAMTVWHGAPSAPTTKTGQALAAFVQTLGPTLALAAFEPPAAKQRAAEAQEAAVQAAILDRLDRIVQLLETR